ncbi:MAG TPA: RNA polymerase sigma factor RpoD/SigA [Gemmataceae bacterium]|nr:RNA polymerase sigma factor RpoD/SigA [Gemmataceae bacterium]
MTCPSRPPSNPSTMEMYLSEINETSLLSAQAEKELGRRIQEGDWEACDHLVRANLRLVVAIARSYVGHGMGIEDLIAEGNLGLLRAAKDFDPSRNTRFSTYASYWIKQAIRRTLIMRGRAIRVPAHTVNLLNKWRRGASRLHDSIGRVPSEDEITRHLRFSRRQFQLVQKALKILNLTTLPDQESSGRTADEMLADDRAPAPDHEMSRAEDFTWARQALDQLEEREATVLRLRFGFGGEEPQTFTAIGQHLGVTRERARQLEQRALNKLRQLVKAG